LVGLVKVVETLNSYRFGLLCLQNYHLLFFSQCVQFLFIRQLFVVYSYGLFYGFIFRFFQSFCLTSYLFSPFLFYLFQSLLSRCSHRLLQSQFLRCLFLSHFLIGFFFCRHLTGKFFPGLLFSQFFFSAGFCGLGGG